MCCYASENYRFKKTKAGKSNEEFLQWGLGGEDQGWLWDKDQGSQKTMKNSWVEVRDQALQRYQVLRRDKKLTRARVFGYRGLQKSLRTAHRKRNISCKEGSWYIWRRSWSVLMRSRVLLKRYRGLELWLGALVLVANILTSVVEMLRVSTQLTFFGVSRFQRDGSCRGCAMGSWDSLANP